ncbi:MAG: ATP synthase subunit I [Clostridiales bacterium]|nr:ATP synthase subunit I [Clostridiales bacterium]MDY5514219.1 ATP synthase subunit I [Candidatus Ventricola sp.]
MNFQKPQETVLRETKRIAVGVFSMLAIMLIVYAAMGRFSLAVVLGGLIGALYAVLNFLLLGMTVQKVADMREENEELARMQMKSSYNMRMVIMILLIVVAFALPFVDGLACMIPMLFPRLTIFVLQLTGKIKDE